MTNRLLLRRTATPGKVPTTSDLQLGELGINTYDGKLYLKKDPGTPSIVEIGAGGGGSAVWGGITGTLSSQTDLQAALDAKAGLSLNNQFTGTNYLLGTSYLTNPIPYPSGVPQSELGSPNFAEMAMFDATITHKTRFYPVANITCAYSTDGTNWTTHAVSDTDKKRLVAGAGATNTAGFGINNGWVKYRIDFANNGYVYINALYLYFSTSGNSTAIRIWKQRVADSVWELHTDSAVTVSNWPGHGYLPFNSISFGTSAGQHKGIRVEFTPTWSHATNPISIYHCELWGGYPAAKRDLYAWDEDKNATFPSNLDAAAVRAMGSNAAVWWQNRDLSGMRAWYSNSDASGTLLYDSGAGGYIMSIQRAGTISMLGSNGSMDLGPQNTSYCHMNTDRSSFLFNKDIQILTANNPSLMLNGSSPLIKLYHSGGGTDNKYWGIYNLMGDLALMTFTDALGGGNTALNITRSGTAITGIVLNCSGTRFYANATGVGFNGATPIARPDYTITGTPTDRTINAAGTSETVATLSNCLATLIQDLISYGLLQ